MNRRNKILRRFSFTAPVLAALLAGCTTNMAPVLYGGDGRPSTSPPVRALPPITLKPTAPRAAPNIVLVRPGDTVFEIARRHGVDLRDLMEANRLTPPFSIAPGQRLVLPKNRFHRVGEGETLYAVSRHYGVDMRALVRLNRIQPPYRVSVGQRLRLPIARSPASVVVGRVTPRKPPVAGRNSKPARAGKSPSRAVLANPPARAASKFLWPVRGRIAVKFGPRGKGIHNDGINILARRGTPVRAAENGIVAYSGNELRGFGNLLLIRHAGGWTSAYAHNDVLLVSAGDRVRRGQTISRVGRSGSVVRSQLHFELRRGKQAVNPVRYLTRKRRAARSFSPVVFPGGRQGPG